MKARRETVRIETPEKIVFSYTIAGLGARIAAFTLDSIIHGLMFFLLILLILATGRYGSLEELVVPQTAGILALGFLFLVLFFIQWGYFLLFEIIWNGKSPGKAALGIRVIRTNGQPLDLSSLVIRNLLRVVDSFPVFNLLGGVVALLDRNTRRLGDIICDTIVVGDIRFNLREPDFETRFSSFVVPGREKPVSRLENRLTENELMILRKFLNRRTQLPPEKQQEVARKLARQVMARLEIKRDILDPLTFIESIYREHTYENTE